MLNKAKKGVSFLLCLMMLLGLTTPVYGASDTEESSLPVSVAAEELPAAEDDMGTLPDESEVANAGAVVPASEPDLPSISGTSPANPSVEIFNEDFNKAALDELGISFFARAGKTDTEWELATDPANAANTALKLTAEDDSIYVKTDESWSNYVFGFRLYVDEVNAVESWRSVAAAWYVNKQNPIDYNYTRFGAKYSHNGQKLTFYARTAKDQDVASTNSGEFVKKWHDYKIVANNGNHKVYIDDMETPVFDQTNAALTGGTVGFDVVNSGLAVLYIDDMKLERQVSSTPTALPAEGEHSSAIDVTLAASDGDAIYYTTDGTDPTQSGELYTSAIYIDTDTTVKAVAMGNGKLYGETVTFDYKITGLDMPRFAPSGGTYKNKVEVSLSSNKEGSKIYYTLDKTEPSETNGTLYNAPFTLTESTIVKAVAVMQGLSDSLVSSGNYKIVTESIEKLYVSPSGNDSNDGSKEAPLATVHKAKEIVRSFNSIMDGDIEVLIAAGDYYFPETLVFTEQDSGQNGHEVIYKGADGLGKTNFIGGEKVEGWVQTVAEDVAFGLDESLVGKVYKVQLDPNEYEFNTLYVNDSRAVMARTLNRDNHPNFPMAKGEYLRSVGGHNNNKDMYYKEGDLDQKTLDGMLKAQARGEKEIAQVFVWDGGDWDWFTNTLPIENIDTTSRKLQFPTDASYPEKYRTKYNIGSGARYFLQGNLAFMDVESEYHYNKHSGVLYYYPKTEDGNINDQNIILPTMQTVLQFKGQDKLDSTNKLDLTATPDPEKQVHNITIDGITVKDTEFADYFTYSWNWGDAGAGIGYYPERATGSSCPTYCESADRVEFRVGAVTLADANNISILNSRIKNTGMYGIVFADDNQYNVVKNSVVENTGYGGVMFDGGYPGIGKYNNNNTLDNLLIHKTGENVGHAVGLTIMSSGQNTMTNLEIFDTPKRAVLFIGAFPRNAGADANFDPALDCYTVGNRLEYTYVHEAQQDAGEDSAVFLSWLMGGDRLKSQHGSNDPNKLTTNLEKLDVSIDRYNYLNQMIIANVGADPSVIEKCTVGGLDTAMGASGTNITNVKAMNTQDHLLAIRPGSYGDMYIVDNNTDDHDSIAPMEIFDDSKMEYDKIGLTSVFPKEYRVSKREYLAPPEDIYFSDDFETSWNGVDKRKWQIEKGEVLMWLAKGFVSEDPLLGKLSLPINSDRNPLGVVVGRGFEQKLNKIVEVKYLDRRKDYAYADASVPVATSIHPNSFLRVDDGETPLGLGAVGKLSKDYYVLWKGNEKIITTVKRYFGWHTLKFDYSSGTDVKVYIDDTEVYQGASEGFDYVAMGDWQGGGGKAYFDQFYIYGGKEAPPVGDVPRPTPPVALEAALLFEDFEKETLEDLSIGFAKTKDNVSYALEQDPKDPTNKVLKFTGQDGSIYVKTDETWTGYSYESRIFVETLGSNEVYTNIGPSWYFEQGSANPNRYQVKYLKESNTFKLYRRNKGDSDLVTVPAPADFMGSWHDYRIENNNGTIVVSIDGKEIFNHKDAALGGGTIGFDITASDPNAVVYVDDIRLMRQSTASPTLSKEGGSYATPFELEVTRKNTQDKIFYTLDGTDPVTNGIYLYEEETISISEDCTLKIVAVQDGKTYSDVTSYDYRIEEPAAQYTITVDAAVKNGTLQVKESAVEGEVVTLAVTPSEGYRLVEGSLKVTSASGEIPVSGGKFTMPAENVSVSAEFELGEDPPATTYQLTVTGGSGSGTYAAVTSVTATAEVPQGKRFVKWAAEGITLTDATANPVTFNMPANDVKLTAMFEDIPAEKILVSSITLAPTTLQFKTGEQGKLVATIEPANATDQTLTWSSKNSGIVDVAQDGTLTAKKAGTTTITATANDGSGKTASCEVTVQDPIVKVSKVTLNMQSKDLKVKQSVQLKATITPANATNKKVSWKSSNSSVATVSSSGKVTAKKNGNATITVTAADGEKATAKIRVSSSYVAASSVKISSRKLALNVKGSATLKATVNPAKASNKKVVWASSNPAVASVSSGGKVTAKSVGKATITATSQEGGKVAKCSVTVKPAVSSVKISKTKLTLTKGKTATLKLTVAPKAASGTTVTWKTSNAKVATVSSRGKVKAIAKGTATISAVVGGKTVKCKVTVK